MSSAETVLSTVGAGLLLGLSAGLAPGPLLALVITQTLRGGARAGVVVAVAPLLTDVPIVGICLVLVGVIAGTGSAAALGAISLVGGSFVAWLAFDTWRAEAPEAPAIDATAVGAASVGAFAAVDAASLGAAAGAEPGPAAAADRTFAPEAGAEAAPPLAVTRGALLKGAIVNAANPHPWLFWIAIGAPTLIAAWAGGGSIAGAGFLAGFYSMLVGSKVALALVVGRARGWIGGRGYRWTMRVLAVLLAAFALGLLRESATQLLGI